ncbi:MAG: M28 family peptidase [Bacteroidales bacterium]|jgi:hypothetical protein|nr:M28 family peptidase [Bacteroidales bacterium]
MKRLLFLLLLLGLSGCSSITCAQDSAFARQVICTLASPEMAGRNIERDGAAKAAAYLSRCFSNMGVLPVDEQYYQYFSCPAFAMDGHAEVQLGLHSLSPQADYRIADYSAALHARLKIVRLSPTLLLPKNRALLEKWQQKAAKSRTPVAVYLNLAEPYKAASEAEGQEFLQAVLKLRYENPFHTAALLIEETQLPPQSLAGSEYERNFTVIYLRAGLLKRAHKSITVDLDNRHTRLATQNVCAMERGAVDSFIVFTAHYDHLGMMGTRVYYPGAHDNASGCAAVLDLARHFHHNPIRYHVLYILFSGEESGLLGSQHFAENPLIDLSKIRLLLNLDMLCGGSDGLMLENVMSIDSGRFYQGMAAANEQFRYHKNLKVRDNAPNSDHYPFTAKGVPAMFIYTLGGRYGGYHAPGDNCEQCGLEEYEQTVRLIISGIKKL